MAQLPYPIEQATHKAVAIRSIVQFRRPDLFHSVRILLRVWQYACRHAQRPERVVPYY